MYRVLLVDDRDIFLMELKRLKVWGNISGFEVAGKANNGRQAMEMLKSSSYDLVLTDIRMPVVDGLQLLRVINQENLCSCVVLLSEYSEFNYARQGIVLGAFDYLVKPPSREKLLELFRRAHRFLETRKKGEDAYGNPLETDFGWAYPSAEEKRVVDGFLNRSPDTAQIFESAVKSVYTMMGDNMIKADILVRKLYHHIIEEVYSKIPWLSDFIDIRFFDATEYLQESGPDTYKEYYCGKITFLLNFIRRYQPEVENGTISEICAYILGHSEDDIKLKVLAEKFYINNTYLSNTFVVKTGMHYNSFVTMVKMARAEYLFKNTDLKTYEICYQLGYHDINYFSRLFKSYIGKSPAEYRSLQLKNCPVAMESCCKIAP
ncbi:response regulator transcription factor [Caproiciproducens sp. CPB-2]|uniref:response regulator transcription factor n=1 Tax=Caproiciproducens sp. CPB-2 TaxID=3030017 RepID=UPI0023D9BD95|nr:response regulator [Caproiciproducens sp. CPB-2]MDF1493416.1 response regulator [Caproiciproducens sp. CPB-2]